MSTDKDWETWGTQDPYYGVLSYAEFRRDKLNASARTEFFASGKRHIDRVLELVSQTFGTSFRPESALDFGCGVGRLVIPLAACTKATTGVDISPSMLAEAQRNVNAFGAGNATLRLSDDTLSRVDGTFSLVHAYIVLQHIPWQQGRRLVSVLADKVEGGGILAVHILTASNASPLVKGIIRLKYMFPPLRWAMNLLRRRPMFDPPMQMNVYDLEALTADLQQCGFPDIKYVPEPDFDHFQNGYLLARRGTT